MEDLVILDMVPCCSSVQDLPCPLSMASEPFDSDVEASSSAKALVEQRIQSSSMNIYLLAFVQFINLLFIYMWLSFSSQRTQFTLLAECLLIGTPLSGILGAFFRSRLWLETFHMSSMLLYCSPLFFCDGNVGHGKSVFDWLRLFHVSNYVALLPVQSIETGAANAPGP